jgi:hypothetical protein
VKYGIVFLYYGHPTGTNAGELWCRSLYAGAWLDPWKRMYPTTDPTPETVVLNATEATTTVFPSGLHTSSFARKVGSMVVFNIVVQYTGSGAASGGVLNGTIIGTIGSSVSDRPGAIHYFPATTYSAGTNIYDRAGAGDVYIQSDGKIAVDKITGNYAGGYVFVSGTYIIGV